MIRLGNEGAGWLAARAVYWHGGDYRAVLSNTAAATSHIYLCFNITKYKHSVSQFLALFQKLVATTLENISSTQKILLSSVNTEN